MRRAVTFGGLGVVVLVAILWLVGALEGVSNALQGLQRAAQDELASAIRSLRANEPGALAAFWTVCLGYGVLHAAGPGHGKLVIGGYGVARRVPVGPLAALALASSLAQATVAVAMVYALIVVLGLARGAVETTAERWMTPFGHAMIAGLGLWLVWRGARGLARHRTDTLPRDERHDHRHHAADDHVHGPNCNHAHGPTLEDVSRVGNWRDAWALVAGIAIRPCSGALFVLILTWQLGIAVAGVIGVFVMGLGTALVTMAAALLSVWAREGLLAGTGARRAARVIPWLELAIGAVIAVAAIGLLVRGL